jgi:hypothetical protein
MRVSCLSLVALLLGSGCSFVFSSGPPAEHQQMPYFDCTSTFGLPVADGFIATGGILGAVSTFRQSKQEFKDKNGKDANRNVAGGINVATAVIAGASAIYGIVQANRCERAKEQLKQRIMAPMLRAPQRPPTLPLPAPVLKPAPPPPAPAPELPAPPAPEPPVSPPAEAPPAP